MFGSGVVAQHCYNVLKSRPLIRAAVAPSFPPDARPRIFQLGAFPEGTLFPAALHYAEEGVYGGTINSVEPPNEERLRYVVRFACEGESDGPIRAAAKDALRALAVEFSSADIAQDGETFHLTLERRNEWILTTEVVGGVFYRQLGFYLDAYVLQT